MIPPDTRPDDMGFCGSDVEHCGWADVPQDGRVGCAETGSHPTDQARSGLGASRFDPARGRILDACCGSRMFWFDRAHPDAIFADIRSETHSLTDASSKGGARSLIIAPDVIADFTALPFEDGTFPLVVFDPPHLVGNGRSGWLAKKYGKLGNGWRDDLRAGFAECFRVLRPEGVLVFKWNEHEIRVSEILALTDVAPLFGNRCGKNAKSHWLVFMKPRDRDGAEGGDANAAPVPQDRQARAGDSIGTADVIAGIAQDGGA